MIGLSACPGVKFTKRPESNGTNAVMIGASGTSLGITPIVIAGDAVGELSSTGWSLKAGRCIALGYVRGAAAQLVHAGTPVLIDLWGQLRRATAWDDPAMSVAMNVPNPAEGDKPAYNFEVWEKA